MAKPLGSESWATSSPFSYTSMVVWAWYAPVVALTERPEFAAMSFS
jgi:hypothetical protein